MKTNLVLRREDDRWETEGPTVVRCL